MGRARCRVEVRRDLGEGGDVAWGIVVVAHILVGALLMVGKVSEPQVVVEQDEHWRRGCWISKEGIKQRQRHKQHSSAQSSPGPELTARSYEQRVGQLHEREPVAYYPR